ncbi:MAG: hypothetical protein QGG53_17040 [Planctomycetota bacterium]|nr:hypothetical protein [Planctomycetota bacterium]
MLDTGYWMLDTRSFVAPLRCGAAPIRNPFLNLSVGFWGRLRLAGSGSDRRPFDRCADT